MQFTWKASKKKFSDTVSIPAIKNGLCIGRVYHVNVAAAHSVSGVKEKLKVTKDKDLILKRYIATWCKKRTVHNCSKHWM